MKKNIEIPLVHRVCPLCNSTNDEKLWLNHHRAFTNNFIWDFHVHNAICKDCGFIYTNPCLDENVLLEYYKDSFARYKGQNLDYDVTKRLEIINRFIIKNDIFIEIGANVKSSFHEKLEDIFLSVMTYEPNNSTMNTFKSIEQVENYKADCISHYYVLEHVPNIKYFLKLCHSSLNDNGIMICEVPLLDKYKKYIAPLILHEHVNHFSENSLKSIVEKSGFEQIYTSSEISSRPFGVVSVFKKSGKNKIKSIKNEYDRNKKLYSDSMIGVASYISNVNTVKKIVFNSTKKIILWAANDISSKIIESKILPNNVTIVDSNPLKKGYFGADVNVFAPDEVIDIIKDSQTLVICTGIHADSIINELKEKYGKYYSQENIIVLDVN